MFKITFFHNIFVFHHNLIYNFCVKFRILVKNMLIDNTVGLINPTYTFHMVLNNTWLADLLLMDERLHNYIKLPPEI